MSITGNSIPMEIKTPGYTPDCAYKAKGFHAGRDIYSLGATLYYMLTGNKPATIDKQVKPDKISPKSWKGICKAMEEDPRIWLRSMDEFLALLPDDDEAEINDIDVPEPIKKLRITPRHVVELKEDEVFVFGSNLHGLHRGGAARVARDMFGAIMGQGVGLQGQSYAIPTMHGPLSEIKPYIDEFIEFAKLHPAKRFLVTRIGCGIAGFKDEEIAPMFKKALPLANVALPKRWFELLESKNYPLDRPYIICHVMSLLDGRIDCDVTEKIESGNEYYEALEQLDCPSTLMGRVTMQMHYASPEPFQANTPAICLYWHKQENRNRQEAPFVYENLHLEF